MLLDYQKPDKAYLDELISVLGLEERRHHLPSQLSGGQQQRAAIGRALFTRPTLILADEPTGNLDSATGEMVMQTFERLRDRGKTIVLITHDPNVAARADRALHILDGRLADGAFAGGGRVGGTLGTRADAGTAAATRLQRAAGPGPGSATSLPNRIPEV